MVTASVVQAQQQNGERTQNNQPTFKEHRIGESAQEFFSIAKMEMKSGMLSTEYCHAYLNDPKAKKAVERAKKKGGDDPSLFAATMIWEGCNNIQAALAGKDVDVDLRFAAEFGSGSAQFVAGRLAFMSFDVKPLFNDVVDDMTSKLNAKPQLGVDTIQNSVGAIVKQRRATWTLPNTLVRVSELHALDGSDDGTEVSVSETAMLKHRANSLN
jgi:hypothetical protein